MVKLADIALAFQLGRVGPVNLPSTKFASLQKKTGGLDNKSNV